MANKINHVLLALAYLSMWAMALRFNFWFEWGLSNLIVQAGLFLYGCMREAFACKHERITFTEARGAVCSDCKKPVKAVSGWALK